MASENTTISIILFKSKTLANGSHPLMLRITKNRVRKYIALGLSTIPKYWDTEKELFKKNHPDKDQLNAIIIKKKNKYQKEVLTYQHDEKDFTPDILIQKVERKVKRVTVLEFFDIIIKENQSQRKVGNANVYKSTKAELNKFTGGKDLSFDQIDPSWLGKFESHLITKGQSSNSISVRMRTLRALFNKAINSKYAKEESYPFNDYKISKLSRITQKRAISKGKIKEIEALKFKLFSAIFEAQQYFLFSYYGQGINFIDIAYLKWKNIEGDKLIYIRAKTGHPIAIRITEPLDQILSYWKPFSGNDKNNFIFPILNQEKHVTSQQEYDRTRKVLKRVNKDLKTIGESIGLGTLTTYVARHSFATVLKHSKVSTAIISEMMGHKTEAITNTYLKNFEDDTIDQALKNL